MGKKIIRTLLPLLVFIFFTVILFRPYFLKGYIPVPGDILIGHYHPWVDNIWEGRTAGYPIKNFILFDGIRQTLPWRLLTIEQFKKGEWPLWNLYTLSGTPLLGNLQTAALYPINILFFLLSELDAWTAYLMLQPILGGIFTYFFLRSISAPKTGATLGGVVYGFSLMMMNHLEFGIDGHTALWLPLALGSINQIQTLGRWRWNFALVISVVMTLLGGYPPIVIYNLAIIGFYSVYKIRPIFSLKALAVIFSLFLSFLIAAPQILPAYELTKKVMRTEEYFGASSGETFFLPWENLIMIIAPDFFGHPATGNFFSKIYYTDNPSIGIIGSLFVIYAIFGLAKRKEILFWLFFAFFPLVLIIKTPVGEFLGRLPWNFLSLVTPLRMIWKVTFSFSVLAGLGMDIAFRLIGKKERKKFLIALAIAWGLIFLIWHLSRVVPKGLNILIAQRNLILPTFFLGATSLALLGAYFSKKNKILHLVACLVIFLAGIELVRQGIKYNPFLPKNLIYPQTEMLKKIQSDKDHWRTLITHQELFPANSNIPYQIPMIDGYASLYDGRYGQLIRLTNAAYPVKDLITYPRIVFQSDYHSQIIDLLGVKYVMAINQTEDEKLKLIAKEGRTLLYENLKVFPKVFFVKNYWVGNSDLEVANKMLTVDLAETVVLEEAPGISLAEMGVGKAEIVEYKDNRIIAKTENDKPSILVLTDSYYPGWKAFIDGKPKGVLRANFDLRAVVVPEGKHEIKFIFDPLSFRIGLSLSFLGLIVLVLSGFLGYNLRKIKL